MRFVRTAACLGLLIAVAAAGQTPRDRKVIAHTKALLVSQLDPKLPAVPFERWLIKEAGEGAQISWEVNDCGEQTGTAEDRDSDFPLCVEAEAHMRDKRVIVVSIAVGTYQRGIAGKPVTWWITVGHDLLRPAAEDVERRTGAADRNPRCATTRSHPRPAHR